MVDVESLIPDYVIERSLGFKTTVIILGAVLLLLSTLIRPEYPILWIVPFLFGALIEWLIVATVYIEISQIESEINQARADIEQTADEVKETQDEIQIVQSEIEEAKDDIFSFISDSQGVGAKDSLEDRISEIEDVVGTGSFSGHNTLQDRVADLERKVERMDRDRGRF